MTDTHGDPSSSTDTARVGIKTSLLGAEKVAERIDETDQLNERSVGQTIGQVDGGWQDTQTSVGAGIGLDVRFFYRFGLNLRVGAAYRVGPGDVTATFR